MWAYGVTLWELWSYGDVPYPTVPNASILTHLRAGRRLGKPQGCHDHVFALMTQCWHPSPPLRPSFAALDLALAEIEHVYLPLCPPPRDVGQLVNGKLTDSIKNLSLNSRARYACV